MSTIHTFWLPKHGSADSEYEDAHASRIAADGRGRPVIRAAVADGATEASFAGIWARLLAAAFVDGELRAAVDPTDDDARLYTDKLDPDALPAIAARWTAAIDAQTAIQPLAWYAEEKLRDGSFAALIGVVVQPDGTWRARAAGDCCVLHVRAGKLLQSFPITRAEDFDNRPALLSTLPARNHSVTIPACVGTWRKGDTLLLMSDALAQFALQHPDALPKLIKLKPEAFAPMIARLRAEKLCRNDDMTLIRLRLDGAPVDTKASSSVSAPAPSDDQP
jgi:hypothetical protein